MLLKLTIEDFRTILGGFITLMDNNWRISMEIPRILWIKGFCEMLLTWLKTFLINYGKMCVYVLSLRCVDVGFAIDTSSSCKVVMQITERVKLPPKIHNFHTRMTQKRNKISCLIYKTHETTLFFWLSLQLSRYVCNTPHRTPKKLDEIA